LLVALSPKPYARPKPASSKTTSPLASASSQAHRWPHGKWLPVRSSQPIGPSESAESMLSLVQWHAGAPISSQALPAAKYPESPGSPERSLLTIDSSQSAAQSPFLAQWHAAAPNLAQMSQARTNCLESAGSTFAQRPLLCLCRSPFASRIIAWFHAARPTTDLFERAPPGFLRPPRSACTPAHLP
jgi:hypothetical protein